MFSNFCLGDFNLNGQPRHGGPSNVDESALLAIVENNPNISTEVITKSLKINMLTAFHHFLSSRQTADFWQIKKVTFSTMTTQDHVFAKQTMQKFKELKYKTFQTSPYFLSWAFGFSFVAVSREQFK